MREKLQRVFNHKTLAGIASGAIIVLTYLLLQNFSAVAALFSRFFQILSPFTLGIIIAYLMNLLLRPIERYVLSFISLPKLRRLLSVLLTLIVFIALFVSLIYAIVPQLVQSISQLISATQKYLAATESVIGDLAIRLSIPVETLENLFGNWSEIVNSLIEWGKNALPDVLNFSLRFGSSLVNILIALFVSLYILIGKESLIRSFKMLLQAMFSQKQFNSLLAVAAKSDRVFTKYIVGTFLDSAAVGIICFIAMVALKIPYPLLISVFIGITNIIPNFGPFIGAVPSTLIILMEDPIKALYFVIFIFILQTIEGNFIAPNIIGDVTGLSALWVLVAIVVGGAFWGVAGMVFGVPVFAVGYNLLSEYIALRLYKKGYDTDGNKIEKKKQQQKN